SSSACISLVVVRATADRRMRWFVLEVKGANLTDRAGRHWYSRRRGTALREHPNGRAHRHVLPHAVDGIAGIGGAAVRPVADTLFEGIIRLAVNHDHATGIDAVRARPGAVAGIGIGNMDGAMVNAVRIAPVEYVSPLRCLFVAAFALVSDRTVTQA